MKNYNAYTLEVLSLELPVKKYYLADDEAKIYIDDNTADVPDDKVKAELSWEKYENSSDYIYKLRLLLNSAVTDFLTLDRATRIIVYNHMVSIKYSLEDLIEYIIQFTRDFNFSQRNKSVLYDLAITINRVIISNNINHQLIDDTFFIFINPILRQKLNIVKLFLEEAGELIEPQVKTIFSTYSNLEVVDINQWWLSFILSKYDDQLEPKLYLPENRNKVTYSREDMVETIELYRFQIASSLPFFNFFEFRVAVRNILLNSTNRDEVKNILKATLEFSNRVIDTYNKDIVKLEKEQIASVSTKGYTIKTIDKLFSITTDRKVSIVNSDSPKFYREKPIYFSNNSLAIFAVNVYNFLQEEVFIGNNKFKKRKTVEELEFTNFDDLFINPEVLIKSIEVLKAYADDDLLTSTNKYIGKDKSIFCVWINQLKALEMIHRANDKVYTDLLNKKFKGLDMSDALFRSTGKKAINKQQQIKAALSKVLQSSQM